MSSFAQYKSREDILAHIRELEDVHIMQNRPMGNANKKGELAQLIQKLKKMAEDFPS